MFLSLLTKKEKLKFLDLAVYMIDIDGKPTEVEKKLLNKAIEHLSGRERTIIELRFGINSKNDNELTQKEVADLLGISQSYISRLEKKIMKRLKKEIVRFE